MTVPSEQELPGTPGSAPLRRTRMTRPCALSYSAIKAVVDAAFDPEQGRSVTSSRPGSFIVLNSNSLQRRWSFSISSEFREGICPSSIPNVLGTRPGSPSGIDPRRLGASRDIQRRSLISKSMVLLQDAATAAVEDNPLALGRLCKASPAPGCTRNHKRVLDFGGRGAHEKRASSI